MIRAIYIFCFGIVVGSMVLGFVDCWWERRKIDKERRERENAQAD